MGLNGDTSGFSAQDQITHPIQADPISTKAVPTSAESARNTKKEPRSGASAVAILSKKNVTAVTRFV